MESLQVAYTLRQGEKGIDDDGDLFDDSFPLFPFISILSIFSTTLAIFLLLVLLTVPL